MKSIRILVENKKTKKRYFHILPLLQLCICDFMLINENVIAYDLSTGLKDKNNKPIYHGDKITHKIYGDLGSVYYENGCFRLQKDDIDIFLGHGQKSKIKITGNIYNI